MSRTLILEALDGLKAGGLKPGPEMEKAHEICQENEGMPLFDWLHALVHRIEGDDGNAAYWYRRAHRTRHSGSVADEWQAIRAAAEDS